MWFIMIKQNKDEIIIEELWITPRGLNNDLSAPAEDIRKEANDVENYTMMTRTSMDLKATI